MREAALAHLNEWLGEARDPDPEQRQWKQWFFDSGVAAYERLGILSREEADGWRARIAEPEAGGDEGGWTAYAPIVEDWVDHAAYARDVPDPEQVRRVVIGSPARHDGLAIVAVVVFDGTVALHFHFLGDSFDPDRSLEAFEQALDRLAPPDLQDDQGTHYGPVRERPVSALGIDRAVAGSWVYEPAPSAAATSFTATRGGHSWQLLDPVTDGT